MVTTMVIAMIIKRQTSNAAFFHNDQQQKTKKHQTAVVRTEHGESLLLIFRKHAVTMTCAEETYQLGSSFAVAST